MSQLGQLKQQLGQIASDARSTGAGLAGFKSKFSASVSQVSGLIGGSAQQADQQIIATLQAAERQVDSAIAALQQASQTAQRYGASL
jgi:hypothetical protein